MAMKKCPNCGKKIAPKAQYCIYCAVRFEKEDTLSISDEINSIDIPLEEESDFCEETIVDSCDVTQVIDAEEIVVQIEQDDVNVTDETQMLDVPVSEETVCLDIPDEKAEKKKRSVRSNFWLVVSIIAFVLIACGAVLLIVHTVSRGNERVSDIDETPATTTTCPSRDAQRDEWMQTFIGEWYDEYSVGKRDIEAQGGYKLTITKIDKDWVFFDLHSYSGGKSSKMASVTGFQEKMLDDTLHFEFANDGLGNAGEGHLQFVEDAVNMEVIICAASDNAAHSLAVNAVFMRQQLPFSAGVDIQSLTDETALTTALGEPVSVSDYNDKDVKTYEYNSLKAEVHRDGRVLTISVDLSKAENKEMYCFDCVDGTDTYDIAKAYYGEAEQDYQESPTNIHVLQYALTEKSSVKFVFSCDEHLLIKMYYVL